MKFHQPKGSSVRIIMRMIELCMNLPIVPMPAFGAAGFALRT